MIKGILFDIDGTLLVRGNDTQRLAFEEAFKNFFHITASIDEIQSSGKTDKRIYVEVLQLHGIPITDINARWEQAAEFMEAYFMKYGRKEEVRLNPGVNELLSQLTKRSHILGVVTGNLEQIGWLKLQHAGIRQFFEVGSFGYLSTNRADLVEESIQQIKQINPDLTRDEIFVVGDTPHDIECGKVSGVKTIAVATGKYSAEQLKTHDPLYLLEDLLATNTIVQTIEKI